MTEQQYEKAQKLQSEIKTLEVALSIAIARGIKIWRLTDPCTGEEHPFLSKLHNEVQDHAIEAIKAQIKFLKVEFQSL